jgi:hypothetical protein
MFIVRSLLTPSHVPALTPIETKKPGALTRPGFGWAQSAYAIVISRSVSSVSRFGCIGTRILQKLCRDVNRSRQRTRGLLWESDTIGRCQSLRRSTQRTRSHRRGGLRDVLGERCRRAPAAAIHVRSRNALGNMLPRVYGAALWPKADTVSARLRAFQRRRASRSGDAAMRRASVIA